MGDFQQFLPIVLMFVVVYLFMIRPQMQRQKKEKQFAADLKKGDRVITKSGLHAKIFEISEKNDAVVLETTAGKLTFDRSSISLELSRKLNAPAETVSKAK
ncbi:preprotein translocase subunit YajC [Aquimarina agarivorans]|uniref:preprotein translocase subunit YajC n=1 Tax=Aquimarina agarivorans TaxID=980584 RepID=UPI000248FB4E|nr:preprotein translocase subunit YajC [Aquimarina agarivorans]